MNKTLMAWLSGTTLVVVSASGQGTFQNLDFEAAQIILVKYSFDNIATTNALPGWSAFSGTNLLSTISYNIFVAAPQVGLYGSNSLAISGTFSVLLSKDGSISQTGLVPADAASLRFKGSWTSSSPVGVSLGGQSLSYTAISSGPNYTLYGADISAFAGQTAKLVFLSPSLSLYFIDDIQLSSQGIPEPSSLALLCCGGLMLAVRRLRVRNS